MNLAARIPGKADYADAAALMPRSLPASACASSRRTRGDAELLARGGFDEFVIATGVAPRTLDMPGADDPRVVSYEAVLSGRVKVGQRVAVIGAGGIGHDVALYLAHSDHAATTEPKAFARALGRRWRAASTPPARKVMLLKRSPGPFGRTLGKTTGWILRQELRDLGVEQMAGVVYRGIDRDGLHISIDNAGRCIAFDTLVVCAGQQPNRSLADALVAAGRSVHPIGGAKLAVELDAKRAIEDGTALGCAIWVPDVGPAMRRKGGVPSGERTNIAHATVDWSTLRADARASSG